MVLKKMYKSFIPESCCIPQRYVFAALGFLANVLCFMTMASLDVTIPQITTSNQTVKHDYESCPNLVFNVSVNETSDVIEENIKPIFKWDESAKADVLGAFLMGYIWTQWPGGWAAEVFGGKQVLNICMIIASISTLLTPVLTSCCETNGLYYMMFIAGLALGPLVAVLMSIASKWVPKREHNFIGVVIFSGAFVGHFLAAYLAEVMKQTIGWEALFYTIGTAEMIWCVLWTVFCYSTPNMHPFISKVEKDHLNDSITSLIRTTKHDYDPLPWKPYFLSSPVWGLTIGYIGIEWISYIVSKQMPIFFRDVYDLDVANSAWSRSPYLCAWISALAVGYAMDIVVQKGFSSLKNVRKITTSIGCIGSCICLVISFYANCSPVTSISWIFIAMIFFGIFYSGIIMNVMDIVPNYSGNTMGVVTNMAVCTVYLLDYLLSVIVKEALLSQWHAYIWAIVIPIVGFEVFYIYYVQTEQVWWDDVRTLGYPEKWTYGLLGADALIDINGTTIARPKLKIEKSV